MTNYKRQLDWQLAQEDLDFRLKKYCPVCYWAVSGRDIYCAYGHGQLSPIDSYDLVEVVYAS